MLSLLSNLMFHIFFLCESIVIFKIHIVHTLPPITSKKKLYTYLKNKHICVKTVHTLVKQLVCNAHKTSRLTTYNVETVKTCQCCSKGNNSLKHPSSQKINIHT